VLDTTGESATGISPAVELLTLRAVSVTSAISYGSLNVGTDTGTFNATTTVNNVGNDNIDAELSGTNLTAGANSIDVDNQRYATSTFDFPVCGVVCSVLTGSASAYELDLPKPTSPSAGTDNVFWGINIPIGTAGVTYGGQNTFTAIGD